MTVSDGIEAAISGNTVIDTVRFDGMSRNLVKRSGMKKAANPLD
jgi:hypothetical protein